MTLVFRQAQKNVCCHYNDFLAEICVRNAIVGSVGAKAFIGSLFAMLYVLLFANKVKVV